MHIRHQSAASPRKSSTKSSSRHASSGSMPLSALDQTPAMPSGAHSLAHELAVALMPEPVGGSDASRLLAEEFGIEYDEGAEGIDDELVVRRNSGGVDMLHPELATVEGDGTSLADELGGGVFDGNLAEELGGIEAENRQAIDPLEDSSDDDKTDRGSDEDEDDATRRAVRAHDAMEVLSQNLASTDKFLAHLRAVDVPPPTSASPLYTKTTFATHTSQLASSGTFTVEGLASDVIRRVNDAVREREGQLRELIAYDRDLKRIFGEVGGADVLGDLEPLEDFVLAEESSAHHVSHVPNKLDSVIEEDEGDQAAFSSSHSTVPSAPPPTTTSSAKPSTSSAISSFAIVVPSLVNLRVDTASLLSSLTTISEQAQVNGAATADAGRKIRSLKNRLGGWKVEWESAERSRTKIERWEVESKALSGSRIDGRTIAADHLRAFEKAIAEAGVKTQAIMAR
ncbi:hypothetical protein BKA82DRAFT_4128826 [Pisolithus tinctorius]|nr:hypothetical protein BKA82DRAFT_4128826 [Pisolithus tinctorius]